MNAGLDIGQRAVQGAKLRLFNPDVDVLLQELPYLRQLGSAVLPYPAVLGRTRSRGACCAPQGVKLGWDARAYATVTLTLTLILTCCAPQGVKLRFFNPDVDVLLLELPAAIPSAFKPFLLGWDATSAAPPRAAVGIHYPHGGPRAITFTKCAGSLSRPVQSGSSQFL